MVIELLEDPAADLFWIRFPRPHEGIQQGMRALIPYEDRDMKRGWGFDWDLLAYKYPLLYLNDVLLICEQLAPAWKIECVGQLRSPEDLRQIAEDDVCS